MNIIESAQEILKIFNDNGFEAYMVGGFVRDYLLGLESHDIDITTNALPEVVQSLFPDNFSKSFKFKTVNVRYNGFEYEITTYRVDSKYKDHRHPVTKVTKKLKDDIKRRDFTINALCMDKDLKVINLSNGIEDLNNKIIRTVGSPERRFREDALRMLRAFRFASKLGFSIEKRTFSAIEEKSVLMKTISKERIKDELSRMLLTPYFKDNIELLLSSNILKYCPDIANALVYLNVNYQQIDILLLLSLASYLKNDITDDLIISRKERKDIEDILYFANILKDRKVTLFSLCEHDFSSIIYAHKLLEILGIDNYDLDELKSLYDNLPIRYIKDLDIDGSDIKKAFNLDGSPLIKDYLLIGFEAVIEEKIKNKKNEILNYLKGKVS